MALSRSMPAALRTRMLITAVLLATGAALLVFAVRPVPTTAPSARAGAAFVPAVDGRRIALGAARGELHVVNFWATSCAVCVAEMPDLAAFAEKTPAVPVIAVAMPYDPPNRVAEFAEQSAFPFTVAFDLAGEALAAFPEFEGTPTTFVIAGDGTIRQTQPGRIDFRRLADALAPGDTSGAP